jgi:hypothetical protein
MQPELFQTDAGARETVSLEDVFAAYYECRRHKRKGGGALQFEVDMEANLVALWRAINAGTWRPRP